MKKITKYVSFDNVEFHTESECLKHEVFRNYIDSIMAKLPKIKVESNEYYQHDLSQVVIAKVSMLKEMKKLVKGYDHVFDEAIKQPAQYFGMIHRIVGDYWYSSNPLNFLSTYWYRFCCIDVKGREFDQSYWIFNQETKDYSKFICINEELTK